MKNKYRNTIGLTILLLWNLLNVFGQTEFLVSINPTNGVFTKIDSLPNVKFITVGPNYTTFDKNNHTFIFTGNDNKWNSYLYAVDANSGNIISNPSISPSVNTFYELKYDNSTNTLYGLHWNSSENREYFVSINPTNGIYTIIDSLPGVKKVVMESITQFDEIHQRYIFRGGDNSENYYLYSIDAKTGKIISNPIFPVLSDTSDAVIGLQFDNTSNKLYALHRDNSASREYLVSINPTSGAFTSIDSLPGVKSVITMPHYFTFDEINHRYIFRGVDNQGKTRLYSVDVNTGKIISSPLFPVLTDSLDNVIELQFDNSSGILYALHWDANTITGISDNEVSNPIILEQNVPNPFAEQTTINYSLPDNTAKAQMLFYNAQGKLIQSTELVQKGKGTLNVFARDLSSGIYTYTLVVDGKIIETKKMIKQ